MSFDDWMAQEVPGADFSKFYLETTPDLIAFLRYLGASYHLAADCVQETMLRALPPRWQTLRNPRAWCRTTCRNSYLRHVERTREFPTSDIAGLGRILLPPDQELRILEEQHDVVHLLRQLPEKRRDVMAFMLDGASTAEIAASLDMNEATVRSTIRYARTQLESLLQNEQG